jgi:hypothetical protein
MTPVLRQMTPVVAPRGGKIHITGLNSPGLTACRKKCNGWRIAPVAGSPRSAITCELCEDAMVRAVQAAREAKEAGKK